MHHFLLPAEGWGATAEAKEARELAPETTEAVRRWRRAIRAKPTKAQLDRLVELSRRVEVLWGLALRRLRIAEDESRRDIPVWGHDQPDHGSRVTREQIEASLADPDGAYQRLRLVMDAWCALWFWPLHGAQRDPAARVRPPTLDKWIEALQALLGRDPRKSRRPDQASFSAAVGWDELGRPRSTTSPSRTRLPVGRVLDDHPWLRVCREVAEQQGFFHWELTFATVFARGGFDLQVGNPPWVRPDVDVDALLAEGDPWWQLTLKPTEREREDKRKRTLDLPGMEDLVIAGVTDVAGTAASVGALTNYPLLAGLRPDLYRCFMSEVWRHARPTGVSMLIHYETHFTDERAGAFRRASYRRLRQHWEFINELLLFEIEDHKHWGVSVFGSAGEPSFQQATSLYHPDTVLRSIHHDGDGPEPGLKDPDGRWDLRPHASRLVQVTPAVLRTWHEMLETDAVPVDRTRMVYSVNRSVARTLEVLGAAPRLRDLELKFSAGWNEKTDRQKGRFVQHWGVPVGWSEVILQGPHLYANTPFYKQPNPTMKHNQDWAEVDLETLAARALPVTAYKPAGSRTRYDADYTHWDGAPARDAYRVAWRRQAANTGERTLASAIVPPGATHVDGVFSAGSPDSNLLTLAAAQLSALLSDFGIRAVPKGDIRAGQVARLAGISSSHDAFPWVALRTLRLNCLTDAYADLWRECFDNAFLADDWTDGRDRVNRPGLGDVEADWTSATPLRIAADRRQAQVEIDALVALMLGVTADELCTVYRTQFAVLYGYDHREYTYDANGRLVPYPVLKVWRTKGDAITLAERTHVNPSGTAYLYELPFGTLDREADMQQACVEFERRLAVRGSSPSATIPAGG